MIVDHTNGRVLDVLESREKTAVTQWLRAGRDSGLLTQVAEVTTDMWRATPRRRGRCSATGCGW